MTTSSPFSPMPSPAAITTVEQAEALTAHYVGVMEALVDVLKQETELVRVGRLSAAAKLAQPKADLTRLYIADTLALRAANPHLSRILDPARLEGLR